MTETAVQSPPSASKPTELPRGLKLTPLRGDNQNPTERNAVMSPVNEDGCFDFDRIIKEGQVLKRTRKTKAWKEVHLVLRPNILSIYRKKDEGNLRHQINLSDLTAIARQKDPKKKAKHVFALFSPSRNYHLDAFSEKEAQDWVDLIRHHARIDEEEEDVLFTSPNGAENKPPKSSQTEKHDLIISSASENERRPTSSVAEHLHSARRPSHTLQYSGNDQGSMSDFSDTHAFRDSNVSLSQSPNTEATRAAEVIQISGIGNPSTAALDTERVIYHGWLYILKTKSGVRQWKKLWVVLRPKTLAFYKNEDEYRAHLILPFENIINAVEIDPISKSKRHCMQIISEERNYRFCAPDEDALAKWLGALKSLLAKRREKSAEYQKNYFRLHSLP
ncbi:PH domain-like protein [Patellaria atrata CBS 101060]|uniref:PH domain-like protein n=1 Tax=Patellaria atrata CBS 101060 TaxID=1346257 RepID=A0A9P4S3J6_9PEZI|nr:PH domain-like protein [Patellaria atrata CBS 101060]